MTSRIQEIELVTLINMGHFYLSLPHKVTVTGLPNLYKKAKTEI